MHAKPLLATPNPAPSFGVAGFGVILRNLADLIARRFLHDPLLAALIIPLWQHLTRAAARLDRLRARLVAGPSRRRGPAPATAAARGTNHPFPPQTPG